MTTCSKQTTSSRTYRLTLLCMRSASLHGGLARAMSSGRSVIRRDRSEDNYASTGKHRQLMTSAPQNAPDVPGIAVHILRMLLGELVELATLQRRKLDAHLYTMIDWCVGNVRIMYLPCLSHHGHYTGLWRSSSVRFSMICVLGLTGRMARPPFPLMVSAHRRQCNLDKLS
jgi:hypothetical protein